MLVCDGRRRGRTPATCRQGRRGLRIWLFGGVRVEHTAAQGTIVLTRSVEALLAFLVLRRERPIARETLTGVFWGDQPEERARCCLNTALWRLRRALEPDGIPRGSYLVGTSAGQIALNQTGDMWIDVEEFKAATTLTKGRQRRVDKPLLHQLESGLRMYTADLLDGHYADWAIAERTHLRLEYVEGLTWLMQRWREIGETERAIDCGLRTLEQDPLQEVVHRELMGLYLEAGQPVEAIRQYETCRAALELELGIRPSNETVTLFQKIRERRVPAPHDSGLHPVGPLGPGSNGDVVRAALQELEQLLYVFDAAASG